MGTNPPRPLDLESATDEEIAQVLAESGVSSLDEEPEGALEFHGYGELISELQRSLDPSDESLDP